MAKKDFKLSAMFKLLQRQVKDYNPAFNLIDVCVAGQAAPALPAVNDCYYYTGTSTATVYGIAGVTQGSFLLFGTGWTKQSIFPRLEGLISFVTDKTTPSKCFQYNSDGNGSLVVPTSVFYVSPYGVNSISNPGVTLTPGSGNIQLIYFNISTRIVSLADYTATTHLTDVNYKVVGYINNGLKYIQINGDVWADGINPSDINDVKSIYRYMGVALPATNPGIPTTKVQYIASVAGTYANFGGLTVSSREIVLFRWNSTTWIKQVIFDKYKGTDISFMTDKATPSKCFQYNSDGNGSLIVPTSVFYVSPYGANSILNPGVTLTAGSGNIQLIYFNISTRTVSLADYTATTHLTDDNYKVIGYINNGSKYIQINGDVYINGIYNGNTLSELTAQNFIFDSLKSKIVVDYYGAAKYAITNNGGTSIFNATDNALEITGSSTGYAGIRFGTFPLTANKNYYLYCEVRRISGDESVWSIGYPTTAGQRVSFTPTDTWQAVEGLFTPVTVNFGLLIASGIGGTDEVIQVRNLVVKSRSFLEESLTSRIVALETGSVVNFDLQAEVNAKMVVFIPEGIHELTSTLVIPSGRKIHGVRGKSIVKAGPALLRLIDIDGVIDVTLNDFDVLGVASNTTLGGLHNGPASGVVDTYLDGVNEVNAGTKTGIYLNASERVNISGLRISNFDKYGIQDKLCGKYYEYGIKVTDNYIHDNYCGIKTESEAEYSTYTANSITKCQIGVYCNSGNNLWSNNHLDKNRIGLVMSNGLNNSHGSFTGCTFNHNTLYSMVLNALSAGEMFTGCQIFYGHIYLKDSKGVVIISSEIGSTYIFADGIVPGGGVCLISSSMFFGGNSIVHNHNGNASNLKLKNNLYADGSDSTAINN